MEEPAEMGQPGMVNGNVPLRQLDRIGICNEKVIYSEQKVESADLQQKGNMAPPESSW